jgi:hypothetical protein
MIIPGEPRHSPALLARRAFDTWGKGSCKYPATATPTQSPSPVPLRLEDTKNPKRLNPERCLREISCRHSSPNSLRLAQRQLGGAT